MGKRSNFDRKDRDYYPTPHEAVAPLIGLLPDRCRFIEPCAGDGRLIRHLEKFNHRCLYACDIEPMGEGIAQRDILFFGGEAFPPCDAIITNPPWERRLLHPMIDLFRLQAPTWLLFDAGWMHTTQAKPYLQYCSVIKSIGRVKWIEGTDTSGMDDCCWYRFEKLCTATRFIGR